jgi:hypothetical protein
MDFIMRLLNLVFAWWDADLPQAYLNDPATKDSDYALAAIIITLLLLALVSFMSGNRRH